MTNFHHAHLMSADADNAAAFYCRWLDGTVVADTQLAGSRNLLLQVGSGRLSVYDQAPNQRGPLNHLGFAVQDLPALVGRMRAGGVVIPGGVKEADMFRYAMVSGPDGLLLELFEFDPARTPPPLREFYCG